MIRYVLVDDEPKNTRILQKMLEEFCPDTCCSGLAASADSAQRIEMLNTTRRRPISVLIEDIDTGDREPSGTRVIIRFPF